MKKTNLILTNLLLAIMLITSGLFAQSTAGSTKSNLVKKANFGGTVRTGAVGFAIGTKGYIGTGQDDCGNCKDFWEFDPITDGTITVSTTNLNFGNVTVGTTSVNTFAVSGANLTGDITITTPNDYTVASGKGVIVVNKAKNNITIPHINGMVPLTTMILTFAPENAQSYNGNVICSSIGAITKNVAVTGTGINPSAINDDILPSETTLSQNYPNPFNPQTTINYSLKDVAAVSINVYNHAGQLVKSLVNGTQQPGFYSAVWNAADISSGIYFYQMKAGDYQMIKRAVVIK